MDSLSAEVTSGRESNANEPCGPCGTSFLLCWYPMYLTPLRVRDVHCNPSPLSSLDPNPVGSVMLQEHHTHTHTYNY